LKKADQYGANVRVDRNHNGPGYSKSVLSANSSD
jgi:hypothetical protein